MPLVTCAAIQTETPYRRVQMLIAFAHVDICRHLDGGSRLSDRPERVVSDTLAAVDGAPRGDVGRGASRLGRQLRPGQMRPRWTQQTRSDAGPAGSAYRDRRSLAQFDAWLKPSAVDRCGFGRVRRFSMTIWPRMSRTACLLRSQGRCGHRGHATKKGEPP
jgi:hypothetical protein